MPSAMFLRILPAPVAEPFAVEWLFVPSTELGGDSFGYHWVDGEHFALYLLDVCGHGVGSALLSITVTNTLRSGALLNTDFRMPEAVLASLNQVFQMENQNGLYFTIWYGVYHRPTGTLRYASAGHPPPILVSGAREQRGKAKSLPAVGCPVGILPDALYESKECTLAGPARLFLFSDGAYEIMRGRTGPCWNPKLSKKSSPAQFRKAHRNWKNSSISFETSTAQKSWTMIFQS